MTEKIIDQDHVPTSKLYMFRCLIAMAHADGIVCDEERAYMHALMSRIPLSDEQRDTLENDLDNEQAIEDLLPYINDPKYRGQLPYFARLMAYKDGQIDPDEEALLGKMNAYARDGLDMDSIRAETQKAVQYDINIHDINIDTMRPNGGLFGLFDRLMLAMGIDLMRD